MTRLHPITRQLPSLLPGSGGLRSPALLRYYEAATTAVSFPPIPPHLPALGQAALWLTSLVRSPWPGSPRPVRLGVINRFHPLPVFGPQGTCGSPKFPENPIVPMPCSRTPAEPRCLAFPAPRGCPPTTVRRGPQRPREISELYHTASALAVYASCRHLRRRRKTRFRGVANLSRVGFQFTH